MTTVANAVEVMSRLAPLDLAEEWDNVGLLVGDPSATLSRLMTCLTVTPDVVAEAVERQAELIVTHHPLPFRPISEITTRSTQGEMLWRLAGAGVSVYSAHTAYDSAQAGINEQLAEGLNLSGVIPFSPSESDPTTGVGRVGDSAPGTTLADLASQAKSLLKINQVHVVGSDDIRAERVALACGSGGSLFDLAIETGCQAIITGEASFHDCLKIRSVGLGLVLLGHYASERFAMEDLSVKLGKSLSGVDVWCSQSESNPLRTL